MRVLNELIIVRHAPVVSDGRFYGRRDLPANCDDKKAFDNLRNELPYPQKLYVSPALRCRQTAQAIWPDFPTDQMHMNANLWEQDFGDWEGIPYENIPDIGERTTEDLAYFQPPNGESFADLYERVIPVIHSLRSETGVVIVAHAGTIRAALSMMAGDKFTGLRHDAPNLSYVKIEGILKVVLSRSSE